MFLGENQRWNRVKFLDSVNGDLTAMRDYPRNSRTGAIRERRSIAAGTLEHLPEKSCQKLGPCKSILAGTPSDDYRANPGAGHWQRPSR
jgi:hypothetical protein